MFEFMETNEQAAEEDEISGVMLATAAPRLIAPLIPKKDERLLEQENHLFESIKNFHEQDLFHDVELSLDGQIIPAHKLVLVSFSSFFKVSTCLSN